MNREGTSTISGPGTLSAIRARLAGRTGQAYWRGLEELSQSEEFRAAVIDEFPAIAPWWEDHSSRRTFLKVMGASLAMAGFAGCAKPPQEKIVPYVNPPEDVIPGVPIFFASAMPINGYAHGVIVESHEGRPTKIEGNPDHPATLGAANVLMQASVLDLYDPDRAKAVRFAEIDTTWGAFLKALRERLATKKASGQGMAILTGTVTSPTLAAQLQELQQMYSGARWHVHEPVGGAHRASDAHSTIYDFSKADVVLSLDSDFMWELPGSLRYARQFMDGRRRQPKVEPHEHKMNRLYVLESTMSLTGSSADHRKAVKPSQLEQVARAIAARAGVASAQGATAPPGFEKFVEAVAEDLTKPLADMNQSSRLAPAGQRATLVIAGESASPAVQALAREMNAALGNVGKTVTYSDSIEVTGAGTLAQLIDDMAADKVDTLFILGPNPVYDAPGDLRTRFAQQLDRLSNAKQSDGTLANFTAYLGLHPNETSFECQWHIPESHYLESWGDSRAFDGTVSIIQPLILPLYQSKTIWEFMETLLGRDDQSGFEIIQSYWRKQRPEDFDTNWRKWLKAGVIENTTAKAIDAGQNSQPATSATAPSTSSNSTTWEIVFRPDYSVWDGRYANNAWLQELPRPFTKLVWDNAALISYRSAETLGVSDGDMVELKLGSADRIQIPVVIVPGVPDKTLTLHLGYHRTKGGTVGTGVGYDVYGLRQSANPHFATNVSVTKTGAKADLVLTRSHHAMNALPGLDRPKEEGVLKPEGIEHPGHDPMEVEVWNRRLVRTANLDDFRTDPHWATRLGGEIEMKEKGIEESQLTEEKKPRRVSLNTMYPTPEEGGWDYSRGLQWAMEIDQTACIGCNACVVACQAENNIPTVGKEECGHQREMHWIRIDDWFGDQPGSYGKTSDGHVGYVADPLDDPQITHQPVPCMQCENAPCELVCPVGATVHSAEGLNQMIYNRCIGTRYCSNNCPYKVRRFNFFLFSDYWTESRKLQYNPDVTVRSRGVMEKCTYCIQRIQETRITLEKTELRYQERIDMARKTGDIEHAEQLRRRLEQEQKATKGALQTACQQACPTEAIIFGDKNDPQSDISQYRADALDYALLVDLTTLPRTRYLARLRNPNPKLLAAGAPEGQAQGT